MFIPKLFIGIGATSAYFTLRETYLHSWQDSCGAHSEVRSFHHQNLSQDADEAFAKAKDWADKDGLELITTRDQMEEEMREIKRAGAEEMTRRAAQEAQWVADRAEMAERWKAKRLAMIDEGKMPTTKYNDYKFEDVPVEYLSWAARNAFEDEVMAHLAEVLLRDFQHLLLPVASPDKTIGDVGKRMEFKATVVRQYGVEVPVFGDFRGRTQTLWITTMVMEDGTCLLSKTTSWTANPGNKVHFKATVKEHSCYKGQMQTVVQRIKELA